ncbi:MAG: response regulator transcription factor [Sphingobacteriales bacterium]|nr:MAG: response regulator transcription factor [Sphingobacteriales bacterium]
MKIKCIVVEDERIAREGLQCYIEKYDCLALAGSFSNAKDALLFLNNHDIALVFLDIELPGIKGIEMAMQLEGALPLIVFTTAYAQYALEGYSVNSIDYLVKPIFPEDFHRAVQKARAFFDYMEKDHKPAAGKELLIKSEGEWLRIQPSEIQFLKSMQNYVIMYSINLKPKMVLQPLKEILTLLPSFFIQTHRSYVVNLNAVQKIGDDHLSIDQYLIPLSRSRKKDVTDYFLSSNK